MHTCIRLFHLTKISVRGGWNLRLLRIDDPPFRGIISYFPIIRARKGVRWPQIGVCRVRHDQRQGLPAMDKGIEAVCAAMTSLEPPVTADQYTIATLSKLMQLFLLLPHSNADSERVLSMVNKISTEHRANLVQDTNVTLLSVKVNSCVDSQSFEPSLDELCTA